MTGWVIDLRSRPEPRLVGGRAAGIGALVFLACFGFGAGLGSLLLR